VLSGYLRRFRSGMSKRGLLATLVTLLFFVWMTKNGLRLPCMCAKCGGADRDYRTVKRHAAAEAANAPLFPLLFPVDQVQDQAPPHPPVPALEDQKAPEPAPPYPAVFVEDMVSHVEAMENCHEPVYDSVKQCVYNALIYAYNVL
jgi:hypothetical protein